MTYEHDDSSGNRLRIEPSNIPGYTRFTVVDSTGLGKSTVHANSTIGEAAAGALEAAGVTPSLTASLDCPEHYEKRALAHLQQAQILRERRNNQTREVTKIAGKLVNVIGAHSDVEVNQETIRALAGWVYETYEKGQEKTTAGRIAFGEAEPGQETLWTTPQGFVLEHDGYRWCLVDVGGVVSHRYTEWEEIPRHYFPATAGTLASRRLLNHLDEEPEHDTIWDTADKFKLWHGGASWLLSNEHGEVVGRFDWGQLPATVFPLRETVQTQRVVRHMVELTEEDRGLQWRDSCGLQWAYDRNNHWWHYWSVPDSEHHRSTPTNFPWRQVTVS